MALNMDIRSVAFGQSIEPVARRMAWAGLALHDMTWHGTD
jgi:hypothetical protein